MYDYGKPSRFIASAREVWTNNKVLSANKILVSAGAVRDGLIDHGLKTTIRIELEKRRKRDKRSPHQMP